MDIINRTITRKEIFKYSVMPEIKPRLAELFTSGLHYIPYFIALVYSSVRLLPPNHPYLNPSNMGLFGIRHVIGEAANNLVLSRKNMDQILQFVCILFGLGIIFIQFFLLGMSLLFSPAIAALPAAKKAESPGQANLVRRPTSCSREQPPDFGSVAGHASMRAGSEICRSRSEMIPGYRPGIISVLVGRILRSCLGDVPENDQRRILVE